MSIYIFTLLFCYMFSLLYYQKVRVEKKTIKYKLIFIMFSLFFCITVGLRSEKIGIDTLNYVRAYLNFEGIDLPSLLDFDITKEIGFVFLNILLNNLRLSWNVFFLVMASLFVIPVMILISKKADNRFYSLVFFILLGWWVFPMSTMRQSTAIGLTVLAFLFEDKGNNFLCIMLIVLAFMFHNSALIVIPYFILRKLPLNKNNFIIWFVIGAVILILGIGPIRNAFFELLTFFGRDYKIVDTTGGLLREFCFIGTLIIGYFVGKNSGDKSYWQYYKAIYLCAILLPIIRVHPALLRVYQYFSIYEIVFIPNMLSKIKERNIRLIGNLSYNVVFIYLFIFNVLLSNLQILPYKFFWQ